MGRAGARLVSYGVAMLQQTRERSIGGVGSNHEVDIPGDPRAQLVGRRRQQTAGALEENRLDAGLVERSHGVASLLSKLAVAPLVGGEHLSDVGADVVGK